MTARRYPTFARSLLCQAVAAALGAAAAASYANPTAPTVVNGTATVTTQGNTTTVTNSPGAIINWRSFSINSGEITRFIQQSAASEVMNRVTGVDPSVILGALQSNGRVFLINPNGIVFGAGAQVNVAGLVASTLNLSNENFIAGKLKFDPQPGAGGIANRGAINVDTGGQVILVAPQIENSGIIRAPEGDIILAAGRSANLVDLKNPDIAVELKAPADRAVNVGQLIAKSVSMYGAIVQNAGTISATSAVVGEGGKISLRAKKDVTTTAASRITADGPTGGSIIIQAEAGAALVSGTVSAAATEKIGGNVQILGRDVAVLDGARIDVGGESGGGKVAIGGSPIAKTPAEPPPVQLAQTAYVAPTAQVTASAAKRGDGGEVVIKSAESTRVFGIVEAKGGDESGRGGSGEMASKGFLLVRRPPDLRAPRGKAGTWLVSSGADVDIVDGRTVSIGDGLVFTTGEGNSTVAIDGMTASVFVLNAEGSIVLRAGTRAEAQQIALASQKNLSIERGAAVSATGTTGGAIEIGADKGLLLADGTIEARGSAGAGGAVSLHADVLMHTGAVRADGATGGTVSMQARNILSAGPVDANGTAGRGGAIDVQATSSVIQTSAAQLSADGTSGAGGRVTVQAGGRVFSSATLSATGAQGPGGAISVLGPDIVLRAAQLDASGDTGGGTVRVGGDWQGKNPAILNAQTTQLNFSTSINVDARRSGDGGKVVVWANDATQFYGRISARGGSQGGDGGRVEVSGKETLTFGGFVDAGAVTGKAGTLLLDPKNIIIDAAASSAPSSIDLVDPHPFANKAFASEVLVLPNGNIVAASPNDTLNGTDAGAVYLFNGTTGALISTLTGLQASDRLGGGTPAFPGPFLIALPSGNFVIRSPNALGQAGAVTWASGTTGVSGTVSSANSLTGTNFTGDRGVTVLPNGNYVVLSTYWSGTANQAGAATWASGTSGLTGSISSSNSFVGANAFDNVGNAITVLPNSNYLIVSRVGLSAIGAVTWQPGNAASPGVLSSANSLIGSTANDNVGSTIAVLTNGNYVVVSPFWNNSTFTQVGAVTWGPGTSGVSGVVSGTNSLIGSTSNDRIGSGGVTTLNNGNYVVSSPFWTNAGQANAGAVTWGSGTAGVTGAVSATNSLVGSTMNDSVGTVTALTNGNYVVASLNWDNGATPNVGAVTWASGTAGITGAVSTSNSLFGTTGGDGVGQGGVTALTNGNYVVRSHFWTNAGVPTAGAVTWGSGTTGITGPVTPSNSLVGSSSGDRVGGTGVLALTNGNYVVGSENWNNNTGAATWGSGTTGASGVVSAANSLVGSSTSDHVANAGMTALSNGNYVIASRDWNNGAATLAGAVTWGSGTTGVTGAVSSANSLVGTNANDAVGSGGVIALSNGNYVVSSPNWNGFRGAATWGSGTSGVSGAVSSTNSLVGSTANDAVSLGGIIALTNGNYVVSSTSWTNGAASGAGAVTWGSGASGVSGTVSPTNSLVGTQANDSVGIGGITALPNGNYVVRSDNWANGAATNAGAVTWGSGTSGVTGAVSSSNSLLGAATNDQLGSGGITAMPNGNFVVSSPQFDNGAADTGRLLIYVPATAVPNPFPFTTNPASDATISPSQITAITNTGTTVVLQANNDITLNASSPITTSASGAGGAITMQAGRSITLNSSITTDNGALALVANETAANGVQTGNRDPGTANITLAAGTTLNAGSGTVSLQFGSGVGPAGDIIFGSGTTITANTATLSGSGSALFASGTVGSPGTELEFAL